jgi:hypothetical protein
MVLQIIPALLEIISSVEKMIPEGNKGKEKLGMVKDIVAVSYEGANEIMPQVEKIVNIAVHTANKTGAFKKPLPPPAPPCN